MTGDISTLSIEALQALLDEKKQEKKAADAQHGREVVDTAPEVFNLVIASTPRTVSKTGREGFDIMTVPFTGEDGKAYTVSIHVTDVVATEAGRARVKAEADAKEAAEKAAKAAAPFAGMALPTTA